MLFSCNSYFPISMHRYSSFSLPIQIIFCCFPGSHLNGQVVVFYYGSGFHFSEDLKSWACIPVLLGHYYVFGEMCI